MEERDEASPPIQAGPSSLRMDATSSIGFTASKTRLPGLATDALEPTYLG